MSLCSVTVCEPIIVLNNYRTKIPKNISFLKNMWIWLRKGPSPNDTELLTGSAILEWLAIRTTFTFEHRVLLAEHPGCPQLKKCKLRKKSAKAVQQ